MTREQILENQLKIAETNIGKMGKQVDTVGKELELLKKERTLLLNKLTNLEKETTNYKIEVNKKPVPVRDILFGFIIGFGFTFLTIFILWFVSQYTESINNFYKGVFCSNQLSQD